ncbi:peptidoglycan-binding domain-containing protein [Primorskyibacter sp. S187A]|uniref:peptidoglycan-binding domain-containing protein n=1 Tax=Primorskyibacter sp. S187A TaxID=3415130 RepID=UPI003C7EB8E2
MTRGRRPQPAVPLFLSACAFVLSGCMQNYDEPARFTALEVSRIAPPPGAPADSCWAQDVTPAVIETVTAQVIVSPAQYDETGQIIRPASYATETRQEIVEPRREIIFETVCATEMTPQFIASLQRALQARAIYLHEITGTFDPQTDAALRLYQRTQGRETGLLTIETAREFGLAPAVWN